MHAVQETGVLSLVRKIPWGKEWQPTPVFLPGEFHEQRNLVGYSPWDCKELDTTEWLTQRNQIGWEDTTGYHLFPLLWMKTLQMFWVVKNPFPCDVLNHKELSYRKVNPGVHDCTLFKEGRGWWWRQIKTLLPQQSSLNAGHTTGTMLSAFVQQEAWHLGSRDQRQQILSAATSL